MLRKDNFKVLSCIFIMMILQTGQCQSNIIEITVDVVQNLYNIVLGVVKFITEDFETANRNELNDMTPDNEEAFDFIVVGAGSAGAAVASKLSEVANITILLIEAGIAENELMDIPILAFPLSLIKSINWDYKMESSSSYCLGMSNHQCKLPRGRVMGGTSVLNAMIAARGSHHDYDNWAKLGCDGWSWNDVFPIFKKMENFEVDGEEIEPAYHSTGGLLNIEKAPYQTEVSRAFLEAGKERGFPIVDYNGKEMIGYSRCQGTVKDGMRVSSNRAYLYPAKKRKNLFLTKYSRVTKILIDEKTKVAYGVEIDKLGEKIRVHANKEVIISAGTIDSPKLLMLSGIGPAAHLKEKNINIMKDSPVGENFMEHVWYLGLEFLVNDTVSIRASDFFQPTNTYISDYFNNRKGPGTIFAGAEVVSFMNIGNLSARQGWPDMEFQMVGSAIDYGLLAPDMMNIAPSPNTKYFKPIFNEESFMIAPTLLHPKSRGKILLKSDKYEDDPIIIPNYFDHPDDMKKMILGIREALKVTQTKAMQKYNTRLPDYAVPGCENYEPNSDDYWDCAIRTFGGSAYHSAGTCKMGSKNDSTAVVDPRLKVIGIERLRVADASIMPVILSSHTSVPAMMIGEKLAQMVKEDWNLT